MDLVPVMEFAADIRPKFFSNICDAVGQQLRFPIHQNLWGGSFLRRVVHAGQARPNSSTYDLGEIKSLIALVSFCDDQAVESVKSPAKDAAMAGSVEARIFACGDGKQRVGEHV